MTNGLSRLRRFRGYPIYLANALGCVCSSAQEKRRMGLEINDRHGNTRASFIERMAENLDAFDFELSAEDTKRIKSLDPGDFTCYDHSDTKVIGGLLQYIKSLM